LIRDAIDQTRRRFYPAAVHLDLLRGGYDRIFDNLSVRVGIGGVETNIEEMASLFRCDADRYTRIQTHAAGARGEGRAWHLGETRGLVDLVHRN
jgi:hypothetical protein